MIEHNFKSFFEAYVEAALWSSMDHVNGEDIHLDAHDGPINETTLKALRDEAETFWIKALAIGVPDTGHDARAAGHDFWLTRNRHGAGFWDGDWGDQGDALTELSHSYPEIDLYIGDDGAIHK